jgi:protein transport protein SEC61 subunit beta
MAKGSQNQVSSTVSKGGSSAAGAGRTGPAGPGPRGTASAASGLRRRRTSSSSSGNGGSGGFGGSGNNMLRFYTDDAPGLKISPTVVLVMSLCFIGFVTALHVVGKLYNYKSGGA